VGFVVQKSKSRKVEEKVKVEVKVEVKVDVERPSFSFRHTGWEREKLSLTQLPRDLLIPGKGINQ